MTRVLKLADATPSRELTEVREALAVVLGSRYRLGREIGAGGMARVFGATDGATGRCVAVKVLAPVLASCCDADRFRREMAVVASLDHPNIVPVLDECDVCGGDRLFYFVMPYIEGESLRERLDREGPLPTDDAVRVLQDVASALEHAHGRGVVHRDIKPANVLLSDGRAFVADFGVAKAIAVAVRSEVVLPHGYPGSYAADWSVHRSAGLTSAGHVVGTLTYAAPEQVAGDPATDYRADLYALGVLAYEMLAGEPPFGARAPAALIAAHLTQTPQALPARAQVPRALSTLIMRLLEKRPEDRPTLTTVRRILDQL